MGWWVIYRISKSTSTEKETGTSCAKKGHWENIATLESNVYLTAGAAKADQRKEKAGRQFAVVARYACAQVYFILAQERQTRSAIYQSSVGKQIRREREREREKERGWRQKLSHRWTWLSQVKKLAKGRGRTHLNSWNSRERRRRSNVTHCH